MTTEPWVIVRSAQLPISVRIDRRVPPVLAGVILATLTLMVINIGVGEYPIAPLDVVKTVLRLPTDNADYHFVVNVLRLPRMLVAASVGLALGVAGAIMQGITRNPLAEPGIIGISAGASLAAVTFIVVVRSASAGVVSLAAFIGAALAALLIYLLAWRKGDSPIRLVLVGIGIGSVASALITLMMTFGDIYDVQRAMIWLTGSVYGRSWAEFWALMPWVTIFVPVALLLARELNVFNLGEEVAGGLGSRVALKRGLLLLTVVALAGASVAAAGAIGFVGLIAPHLARRLVGPLHEGLLPVAGVLGAFIVVAADLAGRTLLAPIELPCGLMTAAIGAPFFLYLLIQAHRR
ncbi:MULTISPECIES: FecCD family ABC transporter permease [Caldilinea]|jgi:iron complex transport system permease protein|uniref:Putative ABC transporter permease protein n=1 Tax=Caldilinea aerophila (strain DSM 14535 / JCM 11387 / NBRC 104270 / STL-6-O1) TaxID=926550 RepID=I0I3M7_CALAS|nr:MULTISPECIES: iron ABC transporter permease [Caldilinea]BAL99864.1 putative ABC transporter permease protein [Caldilinea aerophila DSM 14535 = NBRC 104270]GIV73465.1 MAG: iron ABC transporter permease [Caldilinea sp.]